MGTSRSSILGEATINLSDYVDALKPIVAPFPLHGSDSGAILNVTVQLLTSKTGFREFEQQREVSDKGLQPNTDHDSGKISTPVDPVVSRSDKGNSGVRFKSEPKELASPEEESRFSEECSDSAAGFDGSSNTSGSLYAEKHDNSNTREIYSIKSAISDDAGGMSPNQCPKIDKVSADLRFLVKGTHEWVNHLGTEISVDSEIAVVYEENNRLRRALEDADQSINELKREIISLQNSADGIAVETQKLAEQLIHEIASEQELSEEVSLLKSECLRLKNDLECLRNFKMNPPVPRTKTNDTDKCKQDLSIRWSNGLLVAEDKVREVHNKLRSGLHGKDSSYLLSDLETLLSLLQDLKQSTQYSVYQLVDLPTGKTVTKISEMGVRETDHVISDTGLGVELCHPEGVLLPGLLPHGTGSLDATDAMQGEIFKLLRELDESKAERDSLMRKMDQMECYYEALIQELEENQKQILGELQNLRNEHSSCIYTIASTKTQMEAMHQQLSNELLQLAEERCKLDAVNKELERRAVSSESALRRARLNYSIAVNQLQKDLEMLSLQVLSMYETNANLIRKAFSEASQPLLEDFQETMPRDLDTGDSGVEKLPLAQNLNMGVKSQLLGGDRLLEDLRRSLELQQGLYQKIQEELSEMHLLNVHLDVFSLTLHEALLEAESDCRRAKEQSNEFVEQLELSFTSKEALNLKLQNVMDDLCVLSEEKSSTLLRCNDLAFQNQTLEENMNILFGEKFILGEKIKELETLLIECKSHRGKYEECEAENAKLSILLEQAAAEKEHFSNEMFLLQEKFKALENDASELSSSKVGLQKIIDYLRERLESLLASGNELDSSLLSFGNVEDKKSEFEVFVSIMSQLEKLHQNSHHKTFQLLEEKKELQNERDIAHHSVATAKSEAEMAKQKFLCDVPHMISKLNVSCTLVETLQTNLESVDNKLKVSSEAEAKYTKNIQDLLIDFAKMEALLEELASNNTDLAEEILALRSVTDELEGSKSMIAEVTQTNLELAASLENKTQESDMMALELNHLRGTMGRLENELSIEKHISNRLETEVLNLNTQLKERENDLLYFDHQEADLKNLKQQILEMETEKARISLQMSQLEEQLKKALEDSSSLEDMHTLLLAADFSNTVFAKQYSCHVEDLLKQLECSKQHLDEMCKKSDDLAVCLANKENYAEANTTLLLDLECLRSESASCSSLNKVLEHANSALASEVEEHKRRSDLLESRFKQAKSEHELEIDITKGLLESCRKEIDDLILSKEDIEIRYLLLEAKVNEMNAQSNLQYEYQEELAFLRKQCSELTRKLAEQTLKTEEFKNLSIHLKELNDKAESEYLPAHEKRETEGSSVGMQDSLRIAFVKEQYENKLQEVQRQLSVSKNHGEDMLSKLQDAVEELENRKKCEVSLLERNEELLLKIAELEGELQLVLSDNRERFMAYDQLKAELECSTMSLACCEEEKKQLMATLQECNDEKSRLTDEVELMKEQLENLKALMRRPENENEAMVRENLLGKSAESTSGRGREELSRQASLEKDDAFIGKDTKGISGWENVESGLEHDEVKQVALLSDQLKAQTLLSSMDRLNKELEKMRNENTHLLGDDDSIEPECQGLQREQMHLEKVSAELGNMSSLYKDSSRSGNSIERVLALELELADSLQAKAKMKLGIQFQSSFLKLHNDEAAIFQSFRDINELIKDMLEMKERYGAMATELKEMHERYSQLSLQLAEVEGERQKLTMTLKNVRSSKRLVYRSPSSTHQESSP